VDHDVFYDMTGIEQEDPLLILYPAFHMFCGVLEWCRQLFHTFHRFSISQEKHPASFSPMLESLYN
jgi:hypothetical protein